MHQLYDCGMSTHRLLLVDGSSYLYRAFHAMPDLRNAQGFPTGAIQGMVNMMRRARTELDADHIACVFDAKGKTFRDEMYPEYKANRSSMPEDLALQIEAIHQVVRAMGWPVLVVPGIEADDVIGTLAKQAKASDWNVLISTGDKDLAQLVEPGISLINTMTEERLDSAGVLNKFGVPPERIVDYLSIMGDSVDNVPGVPKAGPKTAVKWLNEFGTLDELMKRSAEVKGVVGENLRASLDWLPKARELVTVKIDCDLKEHLIGLHELHAKSEDKETLRELFTQFGFKSLLRELDRGSNSAPSGTLGATQATSDVKTEAKIADVKEMSAGDLLGFVAELPTEKIERHYSCVTTEAELDVWLRKINSAALTCVDTETTGLDALRVDLVGISLAVSPGEACYIPLAHTTNEDQLNKQSVLEQLKPWLESDEHAKLGQNLKYDIHIFDGCGIKLRGIQHDTLLQSYVLESHRSHDMDSLAMRHLGEKTIAYEEVCGKGVHQITFDQVNLETATQYAAEDADITLRLHHAMYPAIAADEKLLRIYREIEMPAMQALAVMERNGILIDSAKLAAQGQIV